MSKIRNETNNINVSDQEKNSEKETINVNNVEKWQGLGIDSTMEKICQKVNLWTRFSYEVAV